MNHLIPSLGLMATLITATATHAADLTIQIDNIASTNGHLMIAVYDSDSTFLRQPVQATRLAAQTAGNQVTFHDLLPGNYAVAVYHDANANGQLDFQSNGKPQEMIGFSNNAVGQFGPPRFEAVKMVLPTAGTQVQIGLY